MPPAKRTRFYVGTQECDKFNPEESSEDEDEHTSSELPSELQLHTFSWKYTHLEHALQCALETNSMLSEEDIEHVLEMSQQNILDAKHMESILGLAVTYEKTESNEGFNRIDFQIANKFVEDALQWHDIPKVSFLNTWFAKQFYSQSFDAELASLVAAAESASSIVAASAKLASLVAELASPV